MLILTNPDLLQQGVRLNSSHISCIIGTPDSPKASPEEDNFLEGFSGMPIRYSDNNLHTATNDFSVKLGQGGFGSVYQGKLRDGTQVSVKNWKATGRERRNFEPELV
ncbi:hypothetical protein F511_47245 [Dorcoceras hygrometricum]|uniref:Protein kinase domain-containing protein n=1 Tax=Dorcoceras hygrometricum TaxID=472368 RepID=A0A2Z6ZRI5_9LAMI|nr:hypothetical protein F511_47245 [Dorcoceras hygrometricum]